jgi:hypothetical protein
MCGLVIETTLGNTELVTLGAQVVREDWVVSVATWLHGHLLGWLTNRHYCRNVLLLKQTWILFYCTSYSIPHKAYNVKFMLDLVGFC